MIPDEEQALQMGGPVMPGQRHLPPNVINQKVDIGDGQIMVIVFLVLIFYPHFFLRSFRGQETRF